MIKKNTANIVECVRVCVSLTEIEEGKKFVEILTNKYIRND